MNYCLDSYVMERISFAILAIFIHCFINALDKRVNSSLKKVQKVTTIKGDFYQDVYTILIRI